MRYTRPLLSITSSLKQAVTSSSSVDVSSAAAIKANCRKVMCIGRNYAEHVKELNNPTPTQPFFFLKPPTSLHTPSDGPIIRPRGIDMHHEVELGLVIGRRLKNLSPNTPDAEILESSIAAYILAIDMTARNLQSQNKAKGLPWTTAKGFDTFCPISQPFPVSSYPDPYALHLSLSVTTPPKPPIPMDTTVTRQSDSVGLMLFRIPRILSEISRVMTLEPGDVVLTGTPKGVGPLVGGDRVEVTVTQGEKGNEVEGVRTSWEVVDDKADGGYVFTES